MTKTWIHAAAARNAYADLVEPIAATRADEATLCGDWTVRHVTGHLASFVDVGLGSFFLNMAKHRFDYDRAADTLARRQGERSMIELLSVLRAKAGKASAMPMFPESMTVLDVVVHTQDVRRSLGLEGAPDAGLVEMALGFLTDHKMAAQIIPKGAYDGLAISATDLDWSRGEGAEVAGPAEALLMAMTGRPVFDELSGDGVATLRERLTG